MPFEAQFGTDDRVLRLEADVRSCGDARLGFDSMGGSIYREVKPVNRLESYCSRFHCYVCGMVFTHHAKLRKHEVESHGFFRCCHKGCNQIFPHGATLAHHENIFHKPVRCGACFVEVKGTAQIPKHLCAIHGETTPFVCVCDDCDMFFLTPAAHAEHSLQSHKPTRPIDRILLEARVDSVTKEANLPGNKAPTIDDQTVESFFGSFFSHMNTETSPSVLQTPESTYRNVYQFEPVD